MITLRRFCLLEAELRQRGFGPSIDWSETIKPPVDANDYAEGTIYVICNSGMANVVARVIFARCMAALSVGQPAAAVFRHPGKGPAIDAIWADRQRLFADYQAADDKVAQLRSLPWIGDITALHLAKNFGANTAKPDVHMERLARRDRTTTAKLCARLSRQTGYRIATIDTVLWRACEQRILSSQAYEAEGWRTAFKP